MNELTRRFKMSQERKAIIGRALSNMLELRHRLQAIEMLISTFRRDFSLPAETLPPLRKAINEMLPQDENLSKKYEEAIDQLAESDPITAFSFRSKSLVHGFFEEWRQLGVTQGCSLSLVETGEQQLKKVILPQFDQAVRKLAQLHGRNTKHQVESLLAKPFEIPSELQELMELAKSESHRPHESPRNP